MKSIRGIIEKMTDRLNPIVVKELRQAVQGKFLIVVLICFLCLQLLAMGIFLIIDESISVSFDAGRNIFQVLLVILFGTCLLFVPAYTGLRLATERADADVDLLFITTLRPRSIIWGKFLAGFVLTVLLYSACMPFMAFTYLLRGIDLPSIFVLLALDFIVVAVSLQGAILIGCFPANRVFKVILGVGWLVLILAVFQLITLFSFFLLRSGIGSQLDSWKFWRGALGVLGSGLALIGIFALLSIALISPVSTNRALPVRIFITAVWLLTGIGAAIWSIGVGNFVPIAVWAGSHILLHSIGLFIAISEREHLGWRIRRTIPRRPLLRPLAFLFYSGAAGGVAWSSLIIALTLLCMVGWLSAFPLMNTGSDMEEGIGGLAVLGLYTFSYVLSASLIRRTFLADRVPSAYTWVIALVLLGITTTIIPLGLFFLYGTWEKEWLVASPLGSMLSSNSDVMPLSLTIASFSVVFIGALSLPWFFSQFADFKPPREKAASKPQTNESE
ncbi:hypothetical protein J4G02_19100 [Candidatus Poribacteria bacterium]|nr:hypothetical protein [Candidatus Poribacteria bacterium]